MYIDKTYIPVTSASCTGNLTQQTLQRNGKQQKTKTKKEEVTGQPKGLVSDQS